MMIVEQIQVCNLLNGNVKWGQITISYWLHRSKASHLKCHHLNQQDPRLRWSAGCLMMAILYDAR